jgi:hypothetical protein
LVVKTDNLREEVILIEGLKKTTENSLLHILHADWLHSNHARSFQRLRNKSNLDRRLLTGFEEVNLFKLKVIPPVRKKMLTCGENRFEP